MAWLSTDDVACSGFTICTSIDTGDFNCAFEFIWHHNPNYVLLLEALLLKRCLPRFNFASGAELGDQLHVVDVENSTKSETKFFEIFKEKRLSPIPEATNKGKKEIVVNYNAPIPEAMNKGKKAIVVNYNALSKEKRVTTEIELSREDIVQHYGKTEKQAAKELRVSLSTLKRKRNKLGMSGNENTVIKAEYADDIIKLHLGISEATFVTVENEIGKKFKLKHVTFKIKYLDEDEQ